ncbi:unnamed protein product [Cylicocyclus nassatus]|uniref:Uncharacterized protein n=1 Tax=Cylicocyclus nassatus TaxID=53992 RepID=A0AA36M6H5_CYLNA|nr:unnamed protein product [Cylicocyclus nassatus]
MMLERSHPTSVETWPTTEKAASEKLSEIVIDSSDDEEPAEGNDFPTSSKASTASAPPDTHPMPPPPMSDQVVETCSSLRFRIEEGRQQLNNSFSQNCYSKLDAETEAEYKIPPNRYKSTEYACSSYE